MKFVTLLVAAMIVSASASAQTTRRAAEKSTVAHKQQKTKSRKAKSARAKSAAAPTEEVITLTDEKSHKAEWTFAEMLQRSLEIDEKSSATQQRKE